MSDASPITPHASRPTHPVPRSTSYISRLLNRIDAGLLIAALLTLFIIEPLLQPGLPAAADLPIHLYRTMEYERAWAPGVIVPRWAPNLAYGYGYPLFVFAPPLPYWLGLFFHALGFTFETALKNLLILAILLYALGMYLLGRDLLGSAAAGLVAATAYAFAPFALREALHYGGNAPQFLAIGLFPWTLWAVTRATRRESWPWTLLAALFYAGVILSHLFQALIFTPVVGLYGLLIWILKPASLTPKPGHNRFRFLNPLRVPASLLPLLTIPLAMLLSVFFWLPALSERFYTRAQADIYLAKSPFFVRYPHWSELVAWIQPLDARAANPYVPLTLGRVTLALALLGLLAGLWLFINQYRDRRINRWPLSFPLWGGGGGDPAHIPTSPYISLPRSPLILFFAAIAALAIYLSLPGSRPIWERVAILQVAEFPWRMLGLANLGLAFLAGAAMLWLPPKLRPLLAAFCLLIQGLAVAPYLYPVIPFAQYGQVALAGQINYERRSQSIGTTTLGEYLPQTVHRPPKTSPLVEAFQAGQIPERLDRSQLPEGASAALLAQNAVTHHYRLNSPTAFTLRLFQFDYPGWQARLDGQAIPIKPEAETGLILIEAPAGQHELLIHFGETPLRVAALALTGFTIAGALIAVLGPRLIGRRALLPRRAVEISASHRLSCSPITLSLVFLIIGGAFWLKPLLRSMFTLESPPDQALPAQYQAKINFANGIQLIGYDLTQTVVPAGGYLQVVLYWQTKAAPMTANLQPFVHLDRLDDLTTMADATNYTPGDVTTELNMPTFHWDNARYIRDEHDLSIPPDAPPIAYALRVGLIDPDQAGRLIPLTDGSGDTAWLTTINVASQQTRPIKLKQPLDIAFDSHGQGVIRLTGFELVSLSPTRLDFRLTWQSDRTPPLDYTVFAQLLDREQNLVASFDRPPLDGAYPTSTWLPGQTILDPRHIPLPAAPPGEYRLIVGLYDPATGARLPTNLNTDFAEVSRVTIGR